MEPGGGIPANTRWPVELEQCSKGESVREVRR